MVAQSSPANLMDIPIAYTLTFKDHPAIEISAPHPAPWCTSLEVCVRPDENGSIFCEQKAAHKIEFSCTESTSGLYEWLKTWDAFIKQSHQAPVVEPSRYSVRSHKYGVTLTHHLDMVDVQLEFRSLRAAHAHGKRFRIQPHAISGGYPTPYTE